MMWVDPLRVAALNGHSVVDDAPGAPSKVQRWTCDRCGRAVLRALGNVYGSAMTDLCTGVTEAMAAAIADYLAEYPLLLDPLEARDRCLSSSTAFASALAEHDIEAVPVSGLLIADSSELVDGGPIILAGHFAVRVGDQVWDWTLRQFETGCPVPSVTPWVQWQQDWYQPHEGWLDPLDALCPCEIHGGKPQ